MEHHPRPNAQLYALRHPPPERLVVRGRAYRRVKVFKHDFLAATTLYESVATGATPPKLVVKIGRKQVFCGLPLAWVGRLLCRREHSLHRALDRIEGVQHWVGRLDDVTYALEYIEGVTLDSLPGAPPPGFFDRLRELIDRIHAQGIAYCDLNKRSNILVRPDGQAGLIDFQISLLCDARTPRPARWLLRPLVRYLQGVDLYHLYKHKRRLAPSELTDEEDRLSRPQGFWVGLHRALTTPLRRARRWFLRREYRAGRMVSPTAELETHFQPEKATWQQDQRGQGSA